MTKADWYEGCLALYRYARLVNLGEVLDDFKATKEAFEEAGLEFLLQAIDEYEKGMGPYEFCEDWYLEELDLSHPTAAKLAEGLALAHAGKIRGQIYKLRTSAAQTQSKQAKRHLLGYSAG